MAINHNVAHYVIGASALALASYATVHAKQPQLIPAAVHQSVRASPFDWPGFGQDKTIALADAVRGLPPGNATIFCSRLSCHELRLDINDAFRLAEWKTEFEDGVVDAESDTGISVGPPGPGADVVAAALKVATGVKPNIVQIDGIDGVGIIIGKTGN